MTSSNSDSTPITPSPLPRVLLVDDEPAILDGLRRQLRGSFDIATAVGAEEALQLMEVSERFAVVLSDMRMPGLDGAAFLAIVRERYPDTVRLLLTGHSDMESTITAINDGQIYRFLAKPCPGSTVAAALHDAAELHHQIRAESDALRALRDAARALNSSGATEVHTSKTADQAVAPHREKAGTVAETLSGKLAAIRSITSAWQKPGGDDHHGLFSPITSPSGA